MQTPPTRLNYFSGRLLSAEDLAAEQQYHRQKRQLLNQHLHGHGVVCGLLVVPTDPPDPRRVLVAPGLALDGRGREIVVCEPTELDLSSCSGAEELGELEPGEDLFVTLEYEETGVDPVPVPGINDPGSPPTQPSRIVEGSRLSVRPRPVAPADEFPGELLQRIRELVREGGDDETLRRLLVMLASEPCPPRPRDAALTLAAVRLGRGPISEDRIDNVSHRRIVISMRLARALASLE